MVIARRFIVRGRVQGVGFRYFAIRAADECGVVGTVRNMPDGSVEAVAEGSPKAITEFKQILEHGPTMGYVSSVDELRLEPTGRYKDFDIVF